MSCSVDREYGVAHSSQLYRDEWEVPTQDSPTLNYARYAITDRTRFPGDEAEQQAALLQQASQLTATGIDFIQLREKDLEAGALTYLARKILATLRTPRRTSEYTPPRPTPKLLIHSRADIAIAVAADGVHLTSVPGSLTPNQVRQLYAASSLPAPIISVSCHTLDEVAHAAAKTPHAEPDSAASLILFGPVFEKVVATQTISTGTGLELLRTGLYPRRIDPSPCSWRHHSSQRLCLRRRRSRGHRSHPPLPKRI